MQYGLRTLPSSNFFLVPVAVWLGGPELPNYTVRFWYDHLKTGYVINSPDIKVIQDYCFGESLNIGLSAKQYFVLGQAHTGGEWLVLCLGNRWKGSVSCLQRQGYMRSRLRRDYFHRKTLPLSFSLTQLHNIKIIGIYISEEDLKLGFISGRPYHFQSVNISLLAWSFVDFKSEGRHAGFDQYCCFHNQL